MTGSWDMGTKGELYVAVIRNDMIFLTFFLLVPVTVIDHALSSCCEERMSLTLLVEEPIQPPLLRGVNSILGGKGVTEDWAMGMERISSDQNW